jgi:hypothetical protein
MARSSVPRSVDGNVRRITGDDDSGDLDEAESGHIVSRGAISEITEAVELHLSVGARSRDSLLRCVLALTQLFEGSGAAADVVGLRHEFGVFRLTVSIPLGNVTDVVDSRPAAVAGAQLLRTITSELREFTPYLAPAPDDVQVATLETFLQSAPSNTRGTCERLAAALIKGNKSKKLEPFEQMSLPGFSDDFDFIDAVAARAASRTNA